LVLAFVKDLGNVFDATSSGESPTQFVGFRFGAASDQLSWTPQQDVELIGAGGSCSFIVAYNKAYLFSNIGALGTGPITDLLFLNIAASPIAFLRNVKIPLKGGVKVWISAGGGGACVLYYQ